MCMYCNSAVSAHIISVEQGEDWSPGVTAYVMGGALHVEVDADDSYVKGYVTLDDLREWLWDEANTKIEMT